MCYFRCKHHTWTLKQREEDECEDHLKVSSFPEVFQPIQDSGSIKRVASFIRLGVLVTSDARCNKEIKRRMMIAKDSIEKFMSIFSGRKMTL